MNTENPSAPWLQKPPQNTPNQSETPKKTVWKDLAKEVLIFIAIAVGIVLPFRIYIAEPYLVDGRSMDPTFKTGDYLIVNKFSYRVGTPKRNSVIVFRYPNDPKKSFIKRVIGLPGETVEVKDNSVTIFNTENPKGFSIDQSYITHPSLGTYKVTLKDDEFYVMGDNRAESFDSRYWGPLQRKFILGEPIVRLWPVTQMAVLPGDDKK